MSVKAPCAKAIDIARSWHEAAVAGSPPSTVQGFGCTHALHSFDQTLVQCDHEGIKKGIAFAYRELPG